MKKLLIIAAGAVLLLCGCAGNKSNTVYDTKGPLTTGEDCIVNTTSGRILGYNDGGIYTFKGVPYAKAERFMPPQDPTGWDGVLKTQTYGPQAMQSQNMIWGGNPTDYDFGFEFKNEKMSEDCLRLNVWTPALDGKKRAVFVWFHGGGYNSGSAIFLPAQEGRALAQKGDIVVVTVNHRFNILGYIDLTALGGKYSESVNLGQQDLVKALEWVHNNIEKFGGDPGCVAIGGQSGGGGKTSTLMAMPSAKGLFHRAIVQSGSTLRQQEPERSKALGIAVVEDLGLKPGPDVDLSGFSYEEIAAAGSRATRRVGGNFSPVVDGKYLIQHPFDPMGAECSKDVPMLIGSNLNEFTYTNNVTLSMDEVRSRLEPRLGAEKFEQYVTPRTKAILLTSPNNPTGQVIPAEEIKKIAELAVRRDLLIIAEPGYYEYGDWSSPVGTTHGSWNPYDAHIPLLFFGWHVNHGESSREVHINDIAPTVCQMLHIQQPNACSGEAIPEITNR